MGDQPLEVQVDYYVPLLRVLVDMPGGQAAVRPIYKEIDLRYGHRIPEDARQTVPSNPNAIKWENDVAWARQHLINAGLMYAPRHGVWGITEEGRRWLADNPTATHIDWVRGARREASSKPMPRRESQSPPRSAPAPNPGISLEMLERTRQAMGDAAFRTLWGELYDQLVAAERAKAITPLNDNEILQTAQRQIKLIQDFLQGRGQQRPSDEQLCDWIHFCYQFSLYREAVALFSLVNAEDVEPWHLDRTRKIAAACQARL